MRKMLALQAAGLEFDPQNMHQNARRVAGFYIWEMKADPWGSMPSQPRLTGVQIESFVIEYLYIGVMPRKHNLLLLYLSRGWIRADGIRLWGCGR